MYKGKIGIVALWSGMLCFTSCSHGQESIEAKEQKVEPVEADSPGYNEPHQYGGWYCPDNFGGFPPVDIRELDQIPAVADRLPTLEETRNGTSLMYFNTDKIPDARPLKMELPALAKIHNEYNDIDELIIVIQAVIAGNDTVVGYRFPNGGNGSAWYGQVSFLSDEEVEALGSQPIVFAEAEINATRHEIWKAFAETEYARQLGETFNKQEFFSSEWSDDARAHLDVDSDKFRANGIVTIHFGNLYLHIDYDYGDFHYSEKMLLLEDRESNKVKLQLAMGPFPNDFDLQQAKWEKWVQSLKVESETP